MSRSGGTADVGDHERMHRASPAEAVNTAVATLRARGARVTAERRAVIQMLAHTHEHLTADDVATQLESSSPRVHRATAYRVLDLLVEIGIATHRHTRHGPTGYHLVSFATDQAHLHAHCRVCRSVVVIPAEALNAARDDVAAASDFVIEPAQSTLVGLCASCATARPGPL